METKIETDKILKELLNALETNEKKLENSTTMNSLDYYQGKESGLNKAFAIIQRLVEIK